MPSNRVIYGGILIIAAAALLYLGKLLTNFVGPILPWVTGVGVVLMLVGIFMEAQGKRSRAANEDAPL